MDTTTVVSLTGTFLRTVGELLADLKRQDIARLDIDLLELKRTDLAEKLDDFKSDLESAVRQEKARAEQDLVSRGLANSTVRQSTLRAIEQDASTELERATREYNRAIEEIALLEQKGQRTRASLVEKATSLRWNYALAALTRSERWPRNRNDVRRIPPATPSRNHQRRY